MLEVKGADGKEMQEIDREDANCVHLFGIDPVWY
jgi:hypothetical protein